MDAKPVVAKLAGARVLLAEDSPDNQLLLGTVLERAGATVDRVQDGYEAVERALAVQPDLILMDIQMPKMDGFEATQRLRRAGYAKPIIALSAFATRGVRDRCLAAGCTAYVSKPIRTDELVEILSRHAKTPCFAWRDQQSPESRP